MKEKLLELIKSDEFLSLASSRKNREFLAGCQKKRALNRMSAEKLVWFFGYCAGVCGGVDGYKESLKILNKVL